jgi:hypothetical protein
MQRYFLGAIGEILVYPRALSEAEIAATEAYLASAWPAVTLKAAGECRGPPDNGFSISSMYAITRYTQAVQSRGTQWPIKFNGMAFVAAMGTKADYRDCESDALSVMHLHFCVWALYCPHAPSLNLCRGSKQLVRRVVQPAAWEPFTKNGLHTVPCVVCGDAGGRTRVCRTARCLPLATTTSCG